MPRRCTIACDHCGYLQLRRDTDFDQCGRLTRRERNLWIAKAIQIAIILVVGLCCFKIKGVALILVGRKSFKLLGCEATNGSAWRRGRSMEHSHFYLISHNLKK